MASRSPAARVAVVAVALGVASCRRAGVLDPQGPVSAAERLILFNATGIMLVVVLPVIVLTLVFAWWFRASNARATYRPDWEYSGRVELVVWSIPAMVVLLLAGVTWIGSHELDPRMALASDAKPMQVQVVSLDWKWLFIYPDQHLATVNELIVPSGTPIEFSLTSASVMNAFFVPQLGTQIYTMPGMVTRLNLMADHPGDFPGMSSHFSGDGFSDMRFMVHAMTPGDFDRWVTRTREAMPLTGAVYDTLVRATGNLPPARYSSVPESLYEHIVQSAAPVASAGSEER